MKQTGFSCEVFPCDVDESVPDGTPPDETVLIVSRRKAEHAAERTLPPAVIIAADTIVYVNGKILCKPSCEGEAEEMLGELQGAKHTVFTGVTIVGKYESGNRKTKSFAEAADVFMRPLSLFEIKAYVGSGEPMNKAGAYGIQEKGASLIERVEGDYFTVVGLPLARLCVALKEFGIEVSAGWKRE